MAIRRVDLHVHSRHSERPAEWFLQKLTPSESYTDPLDIPGLTGARGMDFVTITDLNRIEGSLALCERHPDRAFTGVEVTATFPESGCRANLLIYGFTPEQYARIDRLRGDIHALRDYLRGCDLPHAVAHAVYSASGRLTVDDVEKLILLFDVFEARNGGRGRAGNTAWTRILRRLDPERLAAMSRRHGLRPEGPDPWRKGLIGGSDDHAGVFAGQTWTEAEAWDVAGFLQAVRERRTRPGGRHNDYRSLVFGTCKIAWDRSREDAAAGRQGFARPAAPRQPIDRFNSLLFAGTSVSAAGAFGALRQGYFDGLVTRSLDRLRLAAWSTQARARQERWPSMVAEMAEGLYARAGEPLDERLDFVYRRIAGIADEFVRDLLASLERDIASGDLAGALRHLVASAPGGLLALPFFSSIRHLNRERDLLRGLLQSQGSEERDRGKRILWFSDTLGDLNGPSTTLSQIGWTALRHRRDITLVGSLPPGTERGHLPPGTIDLPHVYSFRLPYYQAYRMQVPSILQSLEILTEFEPDEIYVSTPGPVGLTGLLLAKLVGCRSVAVYHTDFPRQAEAIADNEALVGVIEDLLRLFCSLADEVAVPTLEYIGILERRGFDPRRMRLFRRGIDVEHFRPRLECRRHLEECFGVAPGIRLLYVGRVSKDKHLDLLADAYRALVNELPQLSLTVTGDGPYLPELRARLADLPRVVFTGRLGPEQLPAIYSGADFLVFPSATDTFGMAVLEAQACGLPALVSDVGGPKELVDHGRTGWVLRAHALDAWIEGIRSAAEGLRDRPSVHARMRAEARRRVVEEREWTGILRDYVEGVGLWNGGDEEDAAGETTQPWAAEAACR